jgi:hypothetical protein
MVWFALFAAAMYTPDSRGEVLFSFVQSIAPTYGLRMPNVFKIANASVQGSQFAPFQLSQKGIHVHFQFLSEHHI